MLVVQTLSGTTVDVNFGRRCGGNLTLSRASRTTHTKGTGASKASMAPGDPRLLLTCRRPPTPEACKRPFHHKMERDLQSKPLGALQQGNPIPQNQVEYTYSPTAYERPDLGRERDGPGLSHVSGCACAGCFPGCAATASVAPKGAP